MSTPGRRRALKALGSRKRNNAARVASGKKPILQGKPVALKTFNAKTGAGLTKKTAKARIASRRKRSK